MSRIGQFQDAYSVAFLRDSVSRTDGPGVILGGHMDNACGLGSFLWDADEVIAVYYAASTV